MAGIVFHGAYLPRLRLSRSAVVEASGWYAPSPGVILQRVLAISVNIAADIAQRGVAAVEDIKDAVRLGRIPANRLLVWLETAESRN